MPDSGSNRGLCRICGRKDLRACALTLFPRRQRFTHVSRIGRNAGLMNRGFFPYHFRAESRLLR